MQSNRLFVGNLDFTVTDKDINETFSQFGIISEACVITDRETGNSRGFAFVTFKNQQEAQAALSLDGQSLNGRYMRVSIASKRNRKSRN
ncbi:MAG: RNA-binding protein [Endozoicomonadaceae bacterium]|nr:RNA-binding protein [Endozoicomonadaceae bacterium]